MAQIYTIYIEWDQTFFFIMSDVCFIKLNMTYWLHKSPLQQKIFSLYTYIFIPQNYELLVSIV